MALFKSIRRQRPVKGGRLKLSASSISAIHARVAADARKFGCSKNFVINTALGHALGIDVEHYDPAVERRRTMRVVMKKGRVG
jgi:hypothetical protein